MFFDTLVTNDLRFAAFDGTYLYAENRMSILVSPESAGFVNETVWLLEFMAERNAICISKPT